MFQPELIVSPFLKKFVPQKIYENYPTYILHPGIRGDKGAYSLDNAIREEKKEWGVVYLRANGEFHGGEIYSEVRFAMRQSYKASLYRNEVNRSPLQALQELLCNVEDANFTPIAQLPTPLHTQLTQKHRRIDWLNDNTQEIIKKIYMSDSLPGVEDEILDSFYEALVHCY